MFGYKNDLRRPSVTVQAMNSSGASSADDTPNGADHHTSYQDHTMLSVSGTLNSSKSIDGSIEIIVVGDETSHKTRFISSFLGNGIAEDPQMLDISCRKSVSIQSGTFNVSMHTTAGQEEFWGVSDSLFRTGHGFIFVYNVNSRDSFDQFLRIREKILYDKNTENLVMAIVGYAGDKDEEGNGSGSFYGGSADATESNIREVEYSDAKHLAELYSCSFYEFANFDKESEGLINAAVHDLLGRITNLNNQRGRSNSVSRETLANGALEQIITKMDVLLVGDIFTGKTQYIQRLIGKNFSNTYKETHPEWTNNLYQTNYKDSRYHVKLWDSRGMGLDSTLTREKLVNISGFIFVYSTTSRSSFLALETIKKQVLTGKGENKVPSIVIGMKSEAIERQVSSEEGQRLAQSWQCPHFEISNINHDDDIIQKPIFQLLGEIQKSNNSIDIGEFKKKGFLLKEGKKLKSMSKYFFKVYKGNLQYSKNEINASSKMNKVKTIELSEQIQIQVVNSDQKRDVYGFQIIDPIRQYYMNLLAPTETERDAWVNTLKLNCYANEMIGMIVDDVVKSFVSDIAEQALSQTNLKRSDSKNNLKENSSANSTPTMGSTPSTPQSPSPLFSSANGHSVNGHHINSHQSDSPPLSDSGSPFKKSSLLTRTSSFKGKTVFK